MSYDIKFKVKVEDTNLWVDVDHYIPEDLNITYNVRDIITKSTGLEWKDEEDNGLVKDVMPKIAEGLAELMRNGDKYKQYEPDNGYGTVEGVKRFFTKCINSWEQFCDDPCTRKFIDYVHFWIM